MTLIQNSLFDCLEGTENEVTPIALNDFFIIKQSGIKLKLQNLYVSQI